MQTSNGVDKKGIIKALVFAILLAFIGIAFLGWQYNKIEKEQIPALEEKIEQKTVEAVLEKFIHARIEENEAMAMRYLTEGAVLQKNSGSFSLLDSFESYELFKSEKLEDGRYRFIIKLHQAGGFGDLVEVIILVKILDQYYIDSVQLAG
ncbi:MAG: hypothetical protein Q8P63_00575 [Candidatus Nealsonbacteria bacterium]|nr:hypothetical protein [Candidatus Nealsonbacteria bacterium]